MNKYSNKVETVCDYQMEACFSNSVQTSDGEYLQFQKTVSNPRFNHRLRQELDQRGFARHPKQKNLFININNHKGNAPEVAEYFLVGKLQTHYRRLQKLSTTTRSGVRQKNRSKTGLSWDTVAASA